MRSTKITILVMLFVVAIQATSFATRIDSVDIIHYNLSLSMQNITSKQITGKASLKVKPNFNNLQVITLDLLKLEIDSIISNNVASSFTQSDSTFSILLDKEYYPQDSILLEIYYHGSPTKDSRWGGFYYSGNYAFNMGVGMGSNPPNFGRCWFPCNDNFTDRATYEFHITTDTGFMAVCSGMQEPATFHPNGSITWHWRLAQTIPTYLANVAVSRYVLINSAYAGIQRNIPVVLAVAAADTSKAKASFFRLNQALLCFEERFGPYLFDRVGYVGVPFNAGAMEHACNISYPLYAVDGTGNYETLMAHELAHSWWGNLVTTRTASDMWLNEGWASYCEALFLECAYGKNAYDEKIGSELFESLRWAHVRDGGFLPVSGVPLAQTYGTHVYTKGGLMVHTLRNMMGDSAFFAACKNYLATLKFRDVNSFNLMDYFTGYSKVNMVDFFNTWIYDAGDHDFQISSFKEQNTPGSFLVEVQQQRRHKTNLVKLAEPNLKIYYTDGSSFTTPISLSFNWEGKASSSINLTSSQSKNIAFVVLNEDNKIVLGKTIQKDWIKTTGVENFSNALLTFTVKNITDSALVYIEHHYAEPNVLNKAMLPAGIRLSRERYWKVNGIWSANNFDATAFFNYDGSTPSTKNAGFLDNELIVGIEDSLVLLHRPNASEPFMVETDLTFQPGPSKTDKVGRFWVNELKRGDYVFGYRDITASTKELTKEKRVLTIFPNPTDNLLTINLPEKHTHGTIKISDNQGRFVKELNFNAGDKKMIIETSKFGSGLFYLTFEDEKGKLSKSFIVK
ncbi:MAG: M1 family aminopeptidase [Bacteroidota bacterium]|nr:M1 family aminopeptidase [Bacteroidota bacterium]